MNAWWQHVGGSAYPVVISSIRLFVTSNNFWSHPKIQQRKDLTFENSPKRLQSILAQATKQMRAAVFLSLLSRQLNDCTCFLIYCTFFDYVQVQGSFKRMISISDSWWPKKEPQKIPVLASCCPLVCFLFQFIILYIKIMQNDYPYQYGVPMKVFLLPMVLSSWALTPKSTTRKEHWDM